MMFSPNRLGLWLALAGVLLCRFTAGAQVFSANFNANASGWSFSTAQGGNDWKWYVDQGVGASGGIRNKNVSTLNWAISPAVSLTGGVTYRISADAKCQTANARTFTMGYNTTASRTGATPIGTTGNLPLNFANYSFTFTPPATGTYHLVFWGTQVGSSTWAMEYFDNVLLELLNTPPTVSLTAPGQAAVFTEGYPISLAADAADPDGTVASVEFFDGSTTLGTDNTAPYSLSWSGATAGPHSLTARVTDNLGAQVTSSAVSVTVNPNTAPSVSISAPAANASFLRGTPVSISATTSDAEGAVAKVEFFLNGTKIGEDLSAPYAFTWTATGLGTQTLSVAATDDLGLSSSPVGVSISVANNLPQTSLSSPAGGSGFVQFETISLSATASDADGSVSKVEFFANGVKIGEDATSPYQLAWVAASQGSQVLTTVATDNDGGTSTSASVTLSVGPFAPQVLGSYDFAANASGWTFSTAGGGNDWKWYATTGVGGTGGLRNKNSNTNNANWAIAPAVSLTGGATYALSVDARIDLGTTARQIEMLYNTSPSLTGATSFFAASLPMNSYNNPPFATYTGFFTPPASGTYYVILRSVGGGWIFMYMDNVVLEKNFSPTVSLTAPAPGSSQNEGSNLNLTVNAADPDGSVVRVEYFANGAAIGTVTAAPFSFTWNQPLPGVYNLTARVTDNRGNQTLSTPVQTTVNFADGTLSEYVDYRFEGGLGDWTFVRTNTDNNAIRHRTTGGWNNSGYLQLFNVNNTSYASSPALYLISGQTYKLEFRNDVGATGRTVVIQYNTAAALGGTQILSFTPATTDDYQILRTATFTVPANGVYYLNIFISNTSGGFQQLGIDNFRVIGSLNQCPITKLTYPATNLSVAQGASLTFSATSVDYDGSVAKVEFYDDGTKLGEDASAPYSLQWTNIPLGTHLVRAVGVDNEGVSLGSSIITLTAADPGFASSGFLGGSQAVDDVRGTVIQKNGTVVLAANISDATPGNLTPTLLNNASASSGGALIRLNATGTQVLSVTRLAARVVDLAIDSSDNLYVAAASDGLLKVNPDASQVLWAKTFTANVHRVDAGPAGYAVALTSAATNYDDVNAVTGVGIWVYDPAGNQTANYGGLLQYTPDVAIDEASQTVISIGFKNIISNTNDGAGNQPVVIPYIQGRDYTGVLKYTGYNWDGDSTSPNYLNRPASNMADTRACRASIGKDGKLYVGYEVAGGNHPIRYSPFNIMTPVTIVGGDNFFSFANTGAEHKLVVARYEPGTGAYLLGQQFCGRLPNGTGNSVKVGEGAIAADQDGRVYVAGASASGIPITLDHLPGEYSGGAFILVLSPNMATREQVVRVNASGEVHALGLRNRNSWAVGGTSGANPVQFVRSPVQVLPGNTSDNGWFAVYQQNNGNAREAVAGEEKTLDKVLRYTLFPNPAQGKQVTLQIRSEQEPLQSRIRVLDMQGRLVSEMESRESDIRIPLGALRSGLYLLQIRIGERDFTDRLVIP